MVIGYVPAGVPPGLTEFVLLPKHATSISENATNKISDCAKRSDCAVSCKKNFPLASTRAANQLARNQSSNGKNPKNNQGRSRSGLAGPLISALAAFAVVVTLTCSGTGAFPVNATLVGFTLQVPCVIVAAQVSLPTESTGHATVTHRLRRNLCQPTFLPGDTTTAVFPALKIVRNQANCRKGLLRNIY
jgi:hypothetical protein